jgi:flagellar hook assembly protein FlgD
VMYMAIDLTTVGNDDMVQPPSIATLQQNFPNPFNPQTTITFNLSKAAPVDLAVYNTKGQIVKSLLKEMAKQGDHSVDWNGTDKNGNPVSSGVYFYRLNNGKTSQSRKMVLMR